MTKRVYMSKHRCKKIVSNEMEGQSARVHERKERKKTERIRAFKERNK